MPLINRYNKHYFPEVIYITHRYASLIPKYQPRRALCYNKAIMHIYIVLYTPVIKLTLKQYLQML